MDVEYRKIESDDETKYSTFYLNSKAEKIFDKSDIDGVFKSIYIMIIRNIQNFFGKRLGWIIDSVIDHTISINKYNSSAGCGYIKLPKELNHPKKIWLIFKKLMMINDLHDFY